MASELVLLTGATGLLGFRVLVFCLRKGNRVRVALRALAKEAQILSTPLVRDLGMETNLTVVANPDVPTFGLVHMAPGHVFSPNELVTEPGALFQVETNRIILVPVTGKAYTMEPGVTVRLNDVGEAHVRALNPSTPGNRLYILSSGGVEGTKLDDCFEIVARNFREHVGSTLLNNGSLPSSVFKVDASESARILGMDFIPYEQQVRDAVGYYLECVQQQRSSTTSD